jgi:iron(III) transport system substrate-binding protein
MNETLTTRIFSLRIAARLAAAALLLAGAAALAQAPNPAAASAAWNQVVEAAKKEGSVTLYSPHGVDQLNDLAARFKQEYGITVLVVRGNPAELQTKVDAEHDTGRGVADVLANSDVPIVVDRNAKKYNVAPLGPAFDDPLYNRKLRVPEGTYFEISAAILTFSWNKDLYPKGIKDYPDLLDPALKGKIGVPMIIAMGQADQYLYLEEKFGADFVRKLAEMNPRLYPGALPMAQAVVSGEIAVGLNTQPLIDEVKKGAPVDWGLTKAGAWGARIYGQILRTAPHPNAAQVLANFMVTRPGQEALARLGASALPNVTGAITSTDSVRMPDWVKLNPEFFKSYVAKWTPMFVKK